MILAQLNQVLFKVTSGDLLLAGFSVASLIAGIVFFRRKFRNKAVPADLKLRQESAFSNIGHRLSAATTRKEAGRVILESAQDLFGWDAAIIQLYDLKSGIAQTIVDVDTFDGRRVESRACTAPETITPMMRKIFEQGPQLVLRSGAEGFNQEVIPFGNVQQRSASLMFVPIRNAGQLIGLLSIQSYQTNFYSREQLETLQRLADHCGGALERISAQESLHKTLAEMEDRVKERTRELSKSNEDLQRKVEQHKEAEEALGREQRLLVAIMNNVPDFIYFKDVKGRFIRVNRSFASQFGCCEPEEMIGKTDFDYFDKAAAAESFADEQNIIQTGTPLIGKEEHEFWLNGHEWWVLTTKMPLRDESQKIIGTFGITRDITPRKQAEEALQKAHASLERRVAERTSELSAANALLKQEIRERTEAEIRTNEFSNLGQQLSQAKNSAEAAELILSTADNLIGWEASYLHLFSAEGKVVPVLMFDLIDGKREMSPDNTRGEGMSTRDHYIVEHGPELTLRDTNDVPANLLLFGSNKPSLSLMYVPIRNGGKAIGVISLQSYTADAYADRDLQTLQTLADFCAGTLERIQAEQALHQSDERFSKAFLSSPVPMTISVLETGRYLAVNDGAVKMFGFSREEMLGHTSADLGIWIDREHRASFIDRLLKQRFVRDTECKLRMKSGAQRTVLLSAEQVDFAGETTILVTIHDITERLTLEEQLRHSQRMEGVGQLAAGVAHDFNNLLTVMQGHIMLLQSFGTLDPKSDECLLQISNAADRASNLTRQLLTFSRKQPIAPRLIDINEVIGNTTKMLHRLLGDNFSMRFNYSPNLSRIFADPGSIEQVLVNLAINARDAMPRGGQVTVTTDSRVISEADAAQNRQASIGPCVWFSVADEGCGISAETLPRIFDPFFTTKEVGKGTGLGLAIVYGIVKQHQGWIEVESEVGRGTSFKVFLPVAKKEPPADQLTPVIADHRGGKETILIVEDEPALRELVRELLQLHGYRIYEAIHGKQALKIWSEKRNEIDLLFTDMVMPEGVSGLDLGKQLKLERPDLKVIYTSGYSMDLFDSNQKLADGFNFLAKPYHPQLLVKTIRECLDTSN